MLHKVGLLPANNTQQIPFAWAMYVRKDAAGWRNSADFKKTFSIDVKIEFVGVWFVQSINARSEYDLTSWSRDTVASVGLFPQELRSSRIMQQSRTSAMPCHWMSTVQNLYQRSTPLKTIAQRRVVTRLSVKSPSEQENRVVSPIPMKKSVTDQAIYPVKQAIESPHDRRNP